jgi:hypothetical protein
MDNVIDDIRSIVEQGGEDNFQASCEVQVIGPNGTDIEAVGDKAYPSVPVRFSVDFDKREWGIKGIGVSIPSQVVTLSVNITKDGGTTEQEIQFDPSELKQDVSEFGRSGVTLGDVVIYLDSSMKVIQEQSSIEVYNPLS